MMNDDAQLLRQYAQAGSDQAFRELVERHLPLVNATARRMTGGNLHLAQDVTQVVFTDLARKAGALSPRVVLAGWLHRHTCYTALKAVRTESRRQTRERIAMEMDAINENSVGDAHWQKMAPVLDEALNCLPAHDREAIVLRYLQQRDVHTVSLALGTSETAAQKRLGRALEKLRAILTRQGITVSAALLTTALDAGAVTTPVASGLAASVSATALSSAAGAAATSLTFTSLTTMITSKLALSAAALVVAAGITTVVLTQNNTPDAPMQAPSAKTSAPLAAPMVNLPAKVATAAKVEAPKTAPAPAGGAPAPETNDPFAAPSDYTLTKSGAGQIMISSADPFAPNSVNIGANTYTGTTVLKAGAVSSTYTTDAGASTSMRSVNVANGQLTITSTGPDGTVDTQVMSAPDGIIPAGSGQDVLTFIDANGVTHTQVMTGSADTIKGVNGTVKGNGTLIIMGNISGNGTSGATLIMGSGSDSSTSSGPANTPSP